MLSMGLSGEKNCCCVSNFSNINNQQTLFLFRIKSVFIILSFLEKKVIIVSSIMDARMSRNKNVKAYRTRKSVRIWPQSISIEALLVLAIWYLVRKPTVSSAADQRFNVEVWKLLQNKVVLCTKYEFPKDFTTSLCHSHSSFFLDQKFRVNFGFAF